MTGVESVQVLRSHRPSPTMYVRVSEGGLKAADTQQRAIRATLESAGTPTGNMHVYRDLDTSGREVGKVLGLLLHEANRGLVDTVIVRNLARFGCYEVLIHALMTLEGNEVPVLIARDLLDDKRCRYQLPPRRERVTGRPPFAPRELHAAFVRDAEVRQTAVAPWQETRGPRDDG